MKLMKHIAVAGLSAALLVGCSEKTKEETKEAIDATGEAASSAVEDSKENLKKVGEIGKATVDKTKEEFSEPDADADSSDGAANSPDSAP